MCLRRHLAPPKARWSEVFNLRARREPLNGGLSHYIKPTVAWLCNFLIDFSLVKLGKIMERLFERFWFDLGRISVLI